MRKATAQQDFGAASYRQAALERIREAYVLLEGEHFAGSVYLAGRGVEAMLRALIWKNDADIQQGKKSLSTGHGLRELLTHVSNSLKQEGERDEQLQSDVQKVARLWFNNLRFASTRFVERWWRQIGEVDGGRTLKRASREYYDACSAIIKRCEVLWQQYSKAKLTDVLTRRLNFERPDFILEKSGRQAEREHRLFNL